MKKLFKDRRLIVVIALVLVAAIMTAVIILQTALQNRSTTTIYAATRNIGTGEEITKNDIATVGVRTDNAEGYITDPAELLGKFALGYIWKGDYLSADKVTDVYNIDTPPEGYNYISLEIPSLAAGVSGFVEAGDYIAIVCYGEPLATTEEDADGDTEGIVPSEGVSPGEAASQQIVTSMLGDEARNTAYIPEGLERIKVVDVRDTANTSLEDAEDAEESTTSGAVVDDETPLPHTFTLLVTDEQAVTIVDAYNSGVIHFMRIGGDSDAEQ